jgi:hypothetical protein
VIDVNIDDFYRDMATVLLALYQQFPRKITLYVDDICGPDETDDFGLHSPRYLSALGAMIWLGDEGYIRYDNIAREEALDQACLTQKGFSKMIRPLNTAATVELPAINATLAHHLHQARMDEDTLTLRRLLETALFN